MAELVHDASVGVGEHIHAKPLSLEANPQLVDSLKRLGVLGPARKALVQVGMEALGEVVLGVAEHGFVRDGPGVQQRPHRAAKERALQQRRVGGGVREVRGNARSVKGHEHVAHVKDDGTQFVVHGTPFVA